MSTPAPQVIASDTVLSIPLALIEVGERLRVVDPARVEVLRHSILANRTKQHSGLLQPIQVRRAGEDGRYRLTAGAHRLAAVEAIGDAAIDAVIRDGSELQARLAEIDENLCRHELTAFDRACFLAERKRLWEEMYPDTARGRAGALARWYDANEKISFASDAAEKAGLSMRAVQMDIKIWTALSAASRARIPGTPLADHQGQLKALAKCGPELQAKVLDALLRGDKPAANVAEAVAEVEGRRKVEPAPDERMYQTLVSAWNRASAKARERFLSQLYEDGARQAFLDGEEAA